MKIAIQGCSHGELDKIYSVLQEATEKNGEKIDLLLCCGDFQAVRNSEDLSCMAVPNKYKEMGSFYKYYNGTKTAPVLTIFIGGNHEASNHLRELGYGGWVAPNIYYIGHCGVVRYGGLRIGGISGIYKKYNYHKGHFESPPYSPETVRSAYHTRSCDVFRLKQVVEDIDIMMSHDWPCGIHRYGNYQQLCRFKPHFREECDNGTLGSPPCMELLDHTHPSYWFSAHLHCKFAAAYHHENGITKFLALDKCLPRGGYLQIIDVPSSPPPFSFQYDPEWLSILKATEPFMYYTSTLWFPPESSSLKDSIATCREEIGKAFNDDFTIPNNFVVTSPSYSTGDRVDLQAVAVDRESPQTVELCGKLGLDSNPWYSNTSHTATSGITDHNPEEISLDMSDEEGEQQQQETEVEKVMKCDDNPDEIYISEDH